MGKKLMNWMLMAAMVLSLGMSVTSCKDDDDDNNNGSSNDETKQQVMSTNVSDDETVLGSLLKAWVEGFTADDVVAGIISKTYEATVGDVMDESQPTVRTLVVGTEAEATSTAAGMLSVLGFNPQSPYGFTWKNDAIGTVDYQRGTGNELGVINVSVKQVPGLSKIRLVKDFEGNASTTPFYHLGDIVKYTGSGSLKGKLFVCVSDHKGGNNATWVSFDTWKQAKKQSKATCGWLGVGKDLYYDKEQASSQTLALWLRHIMLDKERYARVAQALSELSLPEKSQIIPPSEDLRDQFLQALFQDKTSIPLEINKVMDGENRPRSFDFYTFDEGEDRNNRIRKMEPRGLLLADVMRWKMGFTYQYWVPTIVIAERAENMGDYLNSVPSQKNEPSHFMWKKLTDTSIDFDGTPIDIYLTALHWTHEPVIVNDKKYSIVVDFTQTTIDEADYEEDSEADHDWVTYNVTSHELLVKDKGEKYKYFETVYNE